MDIRGTLEMKTRKYVEVYYDRYRYNWDAVIEAELKRRGLERGAVTVIARPRKLNREAYRREAGGNCGDSPN